MCREKLVQIRKKNIYQIPSKIDKLTFNRTRIEFQLWWWPTIWPDFTRLYHGEQCLDDDNGNQNGKMVMMMMTHMLVPCVGNVGQVESTDCHLGWMATWQVWWFWSHGLDFLDYIRETEQFEWSLRQERHLVDKIPSSRLIPCVRSDQITQIIKPIRSSMVC